jgi:hypothetical protein
MAFATAVRTPIAREGFEAIPCDREMPRCWYSIKVRPAQEILLEDGEFMVEGSKGNRLIGRFTGRTRYIPYYKERFVTLELYDIDTVVEYVGDLPVIVGRRGERIPGGTWFTSRNVLV